MGESQHQDTYLVPQQAFAKKKTSCIHYIHIHTSRSQYYWVHFPYKQCGEAIHHQAGAQSRKQTLSHKVIGQLMQ